MWNVVHETSNVVSWINVVCLHLTIYSNSSDLNWCFVVGELGNWKLVLPQCPTVAKSTWFDSFQGIVLGIVPWFPVICWNLNSFYLATCFSRSVSPATNLNKLLAFLNFYNLALTWWSYSWIDNWVENGIVFSPIDLWHVCFLYYFIVSTLYNMICLFVRNNKLSNPLARSHPNHARTYKSYRVSMTQRNILIIHWVC
jgi:hypothetical protein